MKLIFRPLLLSLLVLSISIPFLSANAFAKTTKTRKTSSYPVITKSYKQAPAAAQAIAKTKPEQPPTSRVSVRQPDADPQPEQQPDRQSARQPARQGPAPALSAGDQGLSKKITAKSAIVLDARTGDPLFERSPDNPGQPASTIKVLTGLIALQNLDDNDRVPVSRRAADMPRSKVNLVPRKTYQADKLIDAVLLASANDASVALAEKVAGSEPAFAKLMTKKAQELGATRTVCKTASGLTAAGQYTTARDLAVIFRHAMQNNEFAARMRQHTAPFDGNTLRNHNKALWQIDGAEGGKTGFTQAARQTYVGKFKRGNDEILVAVMGSHTMWSDISNLVEYGFNQKQNQRVAGNEQADPGTPPQIGPAYADSRPNLSEGRKVAEL